MKHLNKFITFYNIENNFFNIVTNNVNNNDILKKIEKKIAESMVQRAILSVPLFARDCDCGNLRP